MGILLADSNLQRRIVLKGILTMRGIPILILRGVACAESVLAKQLEYLKGDNVMKTNVDYSNSAVNLTNPPQVVESLLAQRERQLRLADLQDKMNACIPNELKVELANLQKEIATENEGIKGYIDTFGSYQDLERGMYAVKQRKVSVSYDPQIFRVQYPAYAPAVIKETVDTAKITGLIKGGLLTPEDLENKGVSMKSESYSYIIRT